MTDEEIVKERWPKAYLFMTGVKKEIRRPKVPYDLPSMVNYVLLSGVHYTIEDAWREAARRLSK